MLGVELVVTLQDLKDGLEPHLSGAVLSPRILETDAPAADAVAAADDQNECVAAAGAGAEFSAAVVD